MAFTKVETGLPSEFHLMMKFLASSRLTFCLNEAPIIQCELVEKFWQPAEYQESTNEISFDCKGKPYTLTTTVLGEVKGICNSLFVNTRT